MTLPLEVFRTPAKGWGVRCARPIPVGAFICSYEGLILSHEQAVRLLGLCRRGRRGCHVSTAPCQGPRLGHPPARRSAVRAGGAARHRRRLLLL
jgi:hypothetical protein